MPLMKPMMSVASDTTALKPADLTEPHGLVTLKLQHPPRGRVTSPIRMIRLRKLLASIMIQRYPLDFRIWT